MNIDNYLVPDDVDLVTVYQAEFVNPGNRYFEMARHYQYHIPFYSVGEIIVSGFS